MKVENALDSIDKWENIVEQITKSKNGFPNGFDCWSDWFDAEVLYGCGYCYEYFYCGNDIVEDNRCFKCPLNKRYCSSVVKFDKTFWRLQDACIKEDRVRILNLSKTMLHAVKLYSRIPRYVKEASE